ncbi:SDR family oxidoreductase [Candidatus Pacearchaeota archaeon]|nr:SDR family oxidoreductase [Candidatus Pacearchaeota archaeon]
MMDKMLLKNKVAIVTGSTRGIGKAIVKALVSEGAKVIINSYHSTNEGKELEKELNSQGFNTTYIQADISEEADVQKLFEETIRVYGKIDILINNAGVFLRKNKIEKSKFEDYIEIHKVNGWGVYLCSKYAIQFMETGKIVNISSIYGIQPNPNSILASGVKAEVENYTKSFAKKYKKRIEVNAVAPGYTNTKIVNDNFSSDELKKVTEKMSRKKLLSTKEIANAVIFLIKNDSISGQTITVDGGYLLN